MPIEFRLKNDSESRFFGPGAEAPSWENNDEYQTFLYLQCLMRGISLSDEKPQFIGNVSPKYLNSILFGSAPSYLKREENKVPYFPDFVLSRDNCLVIFDSLKTDASNDIKSAKGKTKGTVLQKLLGDVRSNNSCSNANELKQQIERASICFNSEYRKQRLLRLLGEKINKIDKYKAAVRESLHNSSQEYAYEDSKKRSFMWFLIEDLTPKTETPFYLRDLLPLLTPCQELEGIIYVSVSDLFERRFTLNDVTFIRNGKTAWMQLMGLVSLEKWI